MALALADSLLERCPLDPDSLARHFVAWYRTGPSDVGIQTSNVLGRIARGTPWQAAVDAVQRTKPDSAGNGSVMRCWPVALAHWDDLDTSAGRQPAAEPGDASAPRVRCGQRVRRTRPSTTWCMALRPRKR